MDKAKKSLLALTLFVSTSISSVFAGSIPAGAIVDDYIGGTGNHGATGQDVFGSGYDTKWMQVKRTKDSDGNSFLNVFVNSEFVSKNKAGGINYGDLFLMDGSNYQTPDSCVVAGEAKVGCRDTLHSSDNQWQYAFDLGYARTKSNKKLDYDHRRNGVLREIPASNYANSFITTENYGSGGYSRSNQIVLVKNLNTIRGSGKWWVDTSDNILAMSFNITNTSLASASQIALRWAMTCANDIIEGKVSLASAKPTPVSEPSTLFLMFAAFAGLVVRQKKQSQRIPS